MYSHATIAFKCIKKLSELLLQLDYQRCGFQVRNFKNLPDFPSVLHLPYIVISIFITVSMVLFVITSAPVLYVLFGDVIVMCVYWTLDESRIV